MSLELLGKEQKYSQTLEITESKEAKQDEVAYNYAQQQLAVLLNKAKDSQKIANYKSQTEAAFYYNAALVFCEKNSPALPKQSFETILKQLAELIFNYPHAALSPAEQKSVSTSPLTQEKILAQLRNNPDQSELKRIRKETKDMLAAYQRQQVKPSIIEERKFDKGDAKASTSEAKFTMQEIYQQVTADMKALVARMINECIKEYSPLLGQPPCEYAFIGFGSLAREEMTPYSDWEFGILIADNIHREYFGNITKLLHLRILNLRETTSTIMGIKLPKLSGEEKLISDPVPNGLSFDGVGPGGCKNPLGRPGKFELIGTPEALADYQDDHHYGETGKLKEERFLPSSLAQTCLITGSQNLLKKYLTKVRWHLNKPVDNLWGKPIEDALARQTRALELLLCDIERFRPKMGKLEFEARSYSVKHDLYRLPNTVLDQLALYYELSASSLWDRIRTLAQGESPKPALFNTTAQQNLLRTVDRITEHRLAVYLAAGEQVEDTVLEEQGNAQQAFQSIYNCLIPFWHAARHFRDQRGDAKIFQEVFPDLYSESPFIQGQIQALLQGSYQALAIWEQGINIPASDEKNRLETKAITPTKSLTPLEQGLLCQAAGNASHETNQPTKAERCLRQAIGLFEKYKDSYTPQLSECYLDLALVLKAQGSTKEKEAIEYVDKALKLVEVSYGKAHPYAARCEQTRWYLQRPVGSVYAVKELKLGESWQLPANNAHYFTGREDLLKDLRSRFESIKAAQRIVLSAVSGLGGVGKTQLAQYYIHHPEHHYALRAWFRAESADTLLLDYRTFAQQLNLLPIEEKTSADEIRLAVKRHLEKPPDWLIVYDNAGSYREIKEFLPATGGHLIITTRRQEWHDVGIKLEVKVFTEAEAIVYLKKVIQWEGKQNENEEKALKDLAYELGYLPLALAQAGAYIKKSGILMVDYLRLYRCSTREMLKDKTLPADSNVQPVAITWDISLKAIVAEEQQAGESQLSLLVLQAMAYLHSDHIPRSLLERWLPIITFIKDKQSSELLLNKAIKRLFSYSMIHVHPEQKTVSVHPLVQEVIRLQLTQAKNTIPIPAPAESKGDEKASGVREQPRATFLLTSITASTLEEFNTKTRALEGEERQTALLKIEKQVARSKFIGRYLKFLIECIKTDLELKGNNYEQKSRLIPHILAIKKNTETQLENPCLLESMADLLLEMGAFQTYKQHDCIGGIATIGQALSLCNGIRYLRPTLVYAHYVLGNSLRDYEQQSEAMENYEMALNNLTELTDSEKDRDILYRGGAPILAQMGALLNSLGQPREGINKFKKALDIYKDDKKLDGVKRRQKEKWTFIHLGNAYRGLGEYEQSKYYHEKAYNEANFLKGYDGEEEIAWPCLEYGIDFRILGYPAEAIKLHDKSIEIYSKKGADHPSVAGARNNKGADLCILGEYQKAIGEFEFAIPIFEKLYKGTPHSNLGFAYTYKGVALRRLGKIHEAIIAHKKAKDIYLGCRKSEWHLDVAIAFNELGVDYYYKGNFKKAEKCCLRALEIFKFLKSRDQGFNPRIIYVCLILKKIDEVKKISKWDDNLEKLIELAYGMYGNNIFNIIKIFDNEPRDWLHEKIIIKIDNGSLGKKAIAGDAKTDKIVMPLEERSLDYVQRLQQELGTSYAGTPIVQHGKKPTGLRWVSFSTFWLKQLPSKAIDELSKELHVSKDQFKP